LPALTANASGGKLPPQVKTITAEGIVRANSEKDLRETFIYCRQYCSEKDCSEKGSAGWKIYLKPAKYCFAAVFA